MLVLTTSFQLRGNREKLPFRIVACRAYSISHLATLYHPKASRPRSILIVLRFIQHLFLSSFTSKKGWYLHFIDSSVVVQAPIPAVAELPELFRLKCLSPALEARPHLNGNNPSIPRI